MIKTSRNSCLISDDRTKCLLVSNLLWFIDIEMDGLKKCSECYSNAVKYPDDWFTMVCDEPHLIVWVKYARDYWPAKLMSVDGSKIHVRFFAERTNADVPASKCIQYTEGYPIKRKKPSDSIKAAKKVIAQLDVFPNIQFQSIFPSQSM